MVRINASTPRFMPPISVIAPIPMMAPSTTSHGIQVQGTDLAAKAYKNPVVLQMHDDDFPARFFQDLAAPESSPISSTAVVDLAKDPLFQPVQRMLNVAMVEIACQSIGFPPVDPRRVVSAGLVVRRVVRQAGANGAPAWNDPATQAAWMCNPVGQWSWVTLNATTEDQDPDPKQRPQLVSGQPATDAALAAMMLSISNTESTSPAFTAPPATCANLGRTILYGIIPTASGDVADAQPAVLPPISTGDVLKTLPPPLRSADAPFVAPTVPLPNVTIDYHWLSDDFLGTLYPPTLPSGASSGVALPTPNPLLQPFQDFVTSLRMLHSVFGAFDSDASGNPTAQGTAILNILNRHVLTYSDGVTTIPMGRFYQSAKTVLMDFDPTQAAPTLLMPKTWTWLSTADQTDLLNALVQAATPRSRNLLTSQGRYQDPNRLYRLRIFVRLKGETSNCPTQLVWSSYSDMFRIAAWYETGDRTHPPVPLPDPRSDAVRKAKPNCSFQVPGSLMAAMQGSSLSGLSSGSAGGGGGGMSLGWICGFNIPLITICAFFVLNIFLMLLNIVFFWLPFIKICIPFPMPASAGDDPTP
jgi:hypothetical protein